MGPRIALAIAVLPALWGCHRREAPEVARERVVETLLLSQIQDLKALAAKAEAGKIQTRDHIAIGLAEETAKAIIDASLPQEQVLGERVRVRIEEATPYFRGNTAMVLFEATAQGLKLGTRARIELGGRLVNFRVEEGRLRTNVELVHFKVLDSSLADLGSGVLEGLVQNHLGALARLVPKIEIPVRLEHTLTIGGLDAGVVMAKGGALPLAMGVAEVIPSNQRLWIFLDVKAGPWKAQAKDGKG